MASSTWKAWRSRPRGWILPALTAAAVLGISLVVDILYAVLDPRIRYQ